MKNSTKYILDKFVTTFFVFIAIILAINVYFYIEQQNSNREEDLSQYHEYKNPNFIEVKSVEPSSNDNTFALLVTVFNNSDKALSYMRIRGHLTINGARINNCYSGTFNSSLGPRDTKSYLAHCGGTQATNLPSNLEYDAIVEEVTESSITRHSAGP